MQSAFGVEHGEISKAESALHIPLSIAGQVVPRLRNSPRLLKASDKIDARAERLATKRKSMMQS